ncbi:MAG: hybrid sensor histidine kinase/response regulator, partial [Rhodoferax sp.]|nr:hybrid sensor histidine kinase/response regulator [Rhodoferax sp.]
LGQLTGGLAHDFNNLLHGMGSSLEILQRKLQAGSLGKPEDGERYIAMAQRAVRRAASLTQRLLAFSRRQALDPTPTDVNLLIGSLVDLVRSTVGPGIDVQTPADAALWPTCVDASQLENALLNLCINARDAMQPAGGQITIAAVNQTLDAAEAAQRTLAPGDYIRVSVADTGTGMTPEVIARIFDPFFTTKPLGEGTGLGLSMVYGFVRQSGGQVEVVSAPGQGTTMRLYLQRHFGDAGTKDEARTAVPFLPARQCVVLLVEDDPTIRTLLAEELADAGYRVLVAINGSEGLARLQADQPIDALITDVGLPGGIDGKQLADAGRGLRPGLKVLFITGYAGKAAVGDVLPGPGMALVTKPFEFADLAEKLQKLLE